MSPFEPPYAPDHQPAGLDFEDAVWAAALLAVDPNGLGGIVIRSWSGPARDDFLRRAGGYFPRSRKMPLGIDDHRLLGGLDLAATLQAGRPVQVAGLLAEAAGGLLILAMAERMSGGTAARIAAAVDAAAEDADAGFAIIALDEGLGPDEALPGALLERLAFSVAALPSEAAWPTTPAIRLAQARLARIPAGAETLATICNVAAMLGAGSLRGALFTLRAARAVAALRGHDEIAAEDLAVAIRLVLVPRATQMPAPPEPEEAPAPEDTKAPDEQNTDTAQALEDQVAEAAEARLPPELLAALAAGGPRRATRGAGKSGASASLKRGRPAGSRPGPLTGGAKLSLLDTLRAAAPWQKLRQAGTSRRLVVRPEDFRIRRYKEQARTVAIFAVDASGSSAVNRLAEAKGAIQLLLAECYVRRDEVALLAFRGREAECLLPPTHALARAKRALAGLPGGGPTPLATGIAAARALAEAERRNGHLPLLVLLTDGGANIGRDGKPGRAAAAADALAAAKLCRAGNFSALVVDTAPRANAFVATLAREMGARYLPLPYADAARLSRAVRDQGAAHAIAA
jgi:magnesium chelatase subunit D